MKAHLLKRWDDLRSSYWFVPSLMTLGAIGLSFLTTTLDAHFGPAWIEELDWLYGNEPDGARALLSTVAGSMIGVAGVTFSITIASVVYASGQYGPRLLTNFMRDTGNQITLGTFIATFLYCLLVLRTVRSAEDAPPDAAAADVIGAFVPHIAVLTAVALALASVAVLIFFIHHIPESIHVSNVIAGVGRELNRRVDTLFPERIEAGYTSDADDADHGLPSGFYDVARPVAAPATGYVQGLDVTGLFETACRHDLVLRLTHRPGDFASRGEALLRVWPPGRATDEVCDELADFFALGRQRTALQDIRFLVNELVEIAARALSPGVNDPFTAISCLDWLGSMLKALAPRTFPDTRRYDDDGALRLLTEPTTFAEFTESVFDQLRPYVAADRNAALHMLQVIGEVGGALQRDPEPRDERHEVLCLAADRLLDACEASLLAADLALFRERHAVVLHLLRSGDYAHESPQHSWLGGTA